MLAKARRSWTEQMAIDRVFAIYLVNPGKVKEFSRYNFYCSIACHIDLIVGLVLGLPCGGRLRSVSGKHLLSQC